MPPISAPVAFAHDSQRFDGMRIGFLRYTEALRARGIEVHPYTCVDPSLAARYEVDGAAILGRRFPGGGQMEMAANRLLGVFTRRLERLRESPVHVHSAHLAPLARRRRDVIVGLPDVAKLTTRFYPRGSSWVHNWLLRSLPKAAAVVTSTEWGRGDIAQATGYPIDRIVAVPPFPQFPPPALPFPRPVEPPNESNPWNLLYVAVDRPHKNVELFIRLVAEVGSSYRGVFVGRLTEGHMGLARELGVAGRLQILTEVDDLLAVYRRAHIFVFPSLYEGFGYPLMEAMSQGIPILASSATCVPEVVGHGGRLLDPNHLTPWVEAVRSLAEPSQHREAQRGALSQSHEFTRERTGRGLERAYELVASR